ncbi:hypothetical protein SEA_MORGANA_67 [Gordonia phage Morgana]|uniref:Helix-turn-helix DNA binding domain protein n=1 Tax=Gordonia phage Morgana TaxID=3137292 RepID=A0AAX4RCG5_9CAUD
MRPEQLPRLWRAYAAEIRAGTEHGTIAKALTLDTCADQLEKALQAIDDERITEYGVRDPQGYVNRNTFANRHDAEGIAHDVARKVFGRPCTVVERDVSEWRDVQ